MAVFVELSSVIVRAPGSLLVILIPLLIPFLILIIILILIFHCHRSPAARNDVIKIRTEIRIMKEIGIKSRIKTGAYAR